MTIYRNKFGHDVNNAKVQSIVNLLSHNTACFGFVFPVSLANHVMLFFNDHQLDFDILRENLGIDFVGFSVAPKQFH